MSENSESLPESMASAQDTLYLMEESARGLRNQMRANGWADETSELIASQWFSQALKMSADGVAAAQLEKTQESGWNLLGKVLAVTAGLMAIPAIIFVSIAGFRWALG